MATNKIKKYHLYGTLLLEGGVELNFDNGYVNVYEDLPDWATTLVDGFELPSDKLILVSEEGTGRDFYVPTNRILAYYVEIFEEEF
jgi:hypothetical protein